MPSQARIVWDASFTKYNFGPSHPMAPIRLDLTARLCEALGLFDAPGVEVRGAEPASDELLETVHDPDYVAAVKAASADPTRADPTIIMRWARVLAGSRGGGAPRRPAR